MVLAIALVVVLVAFFMSYRAFKKETHKTKTERVKSMQVFILSWMLVAVTAVALYFAFCYYTGESLF